MKKKAYERKNSFTKPNMVTFKMGSLKLKVEAIFFDLDGTIVNSRNAYFEAAQIAFHALDLNPPTMETALKIPKLLEQNLPIEALIRTDPANFLDVYLKAFYALTAPKTEPIPNIRLALEALKDKAKLAVITMRNFPQARVVKELQEFGLAKYFTLVLTAEDTCKPKPSPEAVKKALTTLNVQACDCLVVGDSVIDIAAGKAAGTKTTAVLSGLYTKQELIKLNPDFILEDVTKLLSLVA